MVADLLRDAQVGREIGVVTVAVERVGIARTQQQGGEGRIVLLGIGEGMAVAVEVDVGHRPDRRIAVAVVYAAARGIAVLVHVEGVFAAVVLRKVLRTLHQRSFESEGDDHADRGHMGRGREVRIQRMGLAAVVGHDGAAPVVGVNSHVGEEFAARRGRRIIGRIQKGLEYAILTDEITKAWTGMTTKEYKQLKGLKKENLRDNMTNMELVLNMLAEVSATEISQSQNPKGLAQHKKVARAGGEVANKARKELESQTGKKVVTDKNAKKLHKQIEVLEKK